MSKMNYIRSVSPFYNAAASVAEGGGLAGGLMGSGRAAQSAPTIKGGYFPQTERLVQRPWYMGGGTELVPVPELEQQEHYADWQNRNPSAYYNDGGTVRQGGRDYTVYNGQVIDDEGNIITGPKANNILARAQSGYTEERKATDEARGKRNQERAKAFAGGVAKMGAGLLPGVGEAMDAGDLYNAARAGDWTGAAISAGALGLGLFPGLGDAAASGLRTIGRGTKNADLLVPAIRHADPDYFDAWKMAARGSEPAAKSVGASAKLGSDPAVYKFAEIDTPQGPKVHSKAAAGDYTDRFGLPNTPEARRAVSDMATDAAAIRAGTRVDDPATSVGKTDWFEAWRPGGRSRNRLYGTKPAYPEYLEDQARDLVDYALPTQAKWKELYPNTPYPTHKPGIMVAPERMINEKGVVNPRYTETKGRPVANALVLPNQRGGTQILDEAGNPTGWTGQRADEHFPGITGPSKNKGPLHGPRRGSKPNKSKSGKPMTASERAQAKAKQFVKPGQKKRRRW